MYFLIDYQDTNALKYPPLIHLVRNDEPDFRKKDNNWTIISARWWCDTESLSSSHLFYLIRVVAKKQ